MKVWLQEFRRSLIAEHLAERDSGLVLNGQRLHKEALVDVIHGLLDMLNVIELEVAELTIAPDGTTLEEWVRRIEIREDVSLEHGLNAIS